MIKQPLLNSFFLFVATLVMLMALSDVTLLAAENSSNVVESKKANISKLVADKQQTLNPNKNPHEKPERSEKQEKQEIGKEENKENDREENKEKMARVKQALVELVSENRSEIRAAIEKLQSLGDPIAIKALQLLKQKRIRKSKQGLLLIVDEDETKAVDYFTGKSVKVNIDDLVVPRVNSPIRSSADTAIFSIQLLSKHEQSRLLAAQQLAKKTEPQLELEDLLRKVFVKEKNAIVKDQLKLVLAYIDFANEDEKRKIAALKVFKQFEIYPAKDQLASLLEKSKTGDFVVSSEGLRSLANELLNLIDRAEKINGFVNWVLEGFSEGSLLLLAAIGLAITFGLMGVINMAHGEMMMLGAFTTYTIQLVFKNYFPEPMADYYLLMAIPCAFMVSGLVGIGIERTVVRYLYGRPLDTLLATWGIALLIIQAIRLTFGAQNVPINVPDYLVGSVHLFNGVSISNVRVAIILFAILVVVIVWFILRQTSLGLQLRAVTQNRSMASSMGIATKKIDMWAFGLGSGIAGLGGVALAQYTNVGPALGQGYIIMSFLVVVIGGVGNLKGTVIGALIVGFASKLIDVWVGENLKLFVLLGFVVLFIQFRPKGLFPQKGRAVVNV